MMGGGTGAAGSAPDGDEREPAVPSLDPVSRQPGTSKRDEHVIRFQLEMTPDEVLDCWRWHQFEGPGSRGLRPDTSHVRGWSPIVLVILSSAFLFWLWYSMYETQTFQPILGLVIGVALVLWWIKVFRRFRRASGDDDISDQHREKAHDAARQIEQGWQVRIDSDGVVYANDLGVSLTRWRGVSFFARSGRVLVLHTARNQDLYFPVRLIAKGVGDDQACEMLREWLLADGGGREHYVPEYLRDRDVPCKKCKYNLRGVTALACPECGLSLDLRSLPEAFARDGRVRNKAGETLQGR